MIIVQTQQNWRIIYLLNTGGIPVVHNADGSGSQLPSIMDSCLSLCSSAYPCLAPSKWHMQHAEQTVCIHNTTDTSIQIYNSYEASK